MDHWQHGGTTDYENLLTVCHNCHNDKIHQQGFIAQWHPGKPTNPDQAANPGRYELQPPDTATTATNTHSDSRIGPRAPPH
ncbi:MAG: HNH endonuclease [Acidimicrobiales bacterium]|nr:HNH endonuclease [Acidimicrobiales bacterium]MYG88526.1 HNH endonuclease [Acidimicrobiales bacterium]MYI27665.1 HNH endonuclease [Acidimicrobiales bacterium]